MPDGVDRADGRDRGEHAGADPPPSTARRPGPVTRAVRAPRDVPVVGDRSSSPRTRLVQPRDAPAGYIAEGGARVGRWELADRGWAASGDGGRAAQAAGAARRPSRRALGTADSGLLYQPGKRTEA